METIKYAIVWSLFLAGTYCMAYAAGREWAELRRAMHARRMKNLADSIFDRIDD